ncbi:hypothetical protein [Halobacillus litoralis]|uniref:Uncharacterized protein n=1 Tax=Halobacillus litoralis TaxID=45668 RepID=A0A410MB58_9BACI|nr:hypothetical protein HLI_06875 [Halobacillus litoralis]
MADKKRNKVAENDQSFQEKLKKEQLTDEIPDEDVKKEEREQKKGRKSKNDSSSEEKYNEDLRP